MGYITIKDFDYKECYQSHVEDYVVEAWRNEEFDIHSTNEISELLPVLKAKYERDKMWRNIDYGYAWNEIDRFRMDEYTVGDALEYYLKHNDRIRLDPETWGYCLNMIVAEYLFAEYFEGYAEDTLREIANDEWTRDLHKWR